MPKIVLNDTAGGYNLTNINLNFQAIADELNDKVLYRDNPDEEPNALITDVDMNGRRLFNLAAPLQPNEAARLQDVQNAIAGQSPASLVSFAPAAGIDATNVQSAIEEAVADSITRFSAPPVIGNDIPTAGFFTDVNVIGTITLGRVRTNRGNTSVSSGLATNLFTISTSNRGRYEIVAYIQDHLDAAAYNSAATVIWNGLTGRMVASNGTDLILSLTGDVIQVTHTLGFTETVSWSFLYID